jgi:hypothetical protein
MLDTIALTLDQHEFEVLDPGRFSPSAQGLLNPPYYKLGGRGVFQCVQNPTKKDFAEGRYGPRLTLAKRIRQGGFSITLRIEFSAPKLLFGNNFDELRSRDFDAVADTLHRALTGMGVGVSTETLRAARVSTIHYSKNMAFTDYTNCSMVMRELGRIDLNQRLDLSHTDYRNEGHAIRYHANNFEVTFYDKLKDLRKARVSEKRAIEQDYGGQRDLFATPGMFLKQLEVLRMEVRLGNRAKIMRVMGQVGAAVEPTFAALFDMGVAKAVLRHFWADVSRQMLLAGQTTQRPEDVLAVLAAAAEGRARASTLLQQLGCVMLARSVGIRGASAIMSRHCSARSWQRYKRQLKELPLADGDGFSALRQVDSALRRFESLRLADLQTGI